VSDALRLSFTVEDEAVLASFRRVESGLHDVIVKLAEDLAHEAAMEAGHRSSRLGMPWEIQGTGSLERHVVAPEWWAHFLAGGTVAHGPTSADKLVFEVDGEVVFASFVSGIPGDHFDERAVGKTRGHVDDIMRRVIASAT
jgi:hypothetical protein